MFDRRRVLALIPARGGSKGIPKKNIANCCGKPLLAWTVEAAQGAKYIDRIVLSTDDPETRSVAIAYGCEVPFIRPGYLASDSTQTIDVIWHALEYVSGYDLVVLLQPTSPLRTSTDIDECIEFAFNKDAAAVVSITPSREHPFLSFQMDQLNRLKPFISRQPNESLRRQDFPDAYRVNGSIYLAHIPWLKATRTFFSAETHGFIMPACRSIDIDTKDDLARAESLLRDRARFC